MGKTAKVITDKKTEIQQKELTLLSDASVTFVSLVSHGANGEPFLIVKSRKDDKAEFTEKVVQRVIIAKDMPEDKKMEILMTKGMKGATKKEYDTYEAYDQFPKEDCVPGSFSGMTLHGGKVVFITAELTEGAVEKLYKEGGEEERVEKKTVDVSKAAVSWEVNYKIYDEVSAMSGLVQGALAQGEATLDWRKTTIKQAVSNFSSAMQVIIDSITEEDMAKAAKVLQDKLGGVTLPAELLETIKSAAQILENKANVTKTQSKEEPIMTLVEMLQDPESAKALKDFSRTVIDEYIAEKAASDAAKKAAEDAVAAKVAAEKAAAETQATITKMAAEIETLKTGKLEPGSAETPPETPVPVVKADKKENVFKGLFFNA